MDVSRWQVHTTPSEEKGDEWISTGQRFTLYSLSCHRITVAVAAKRTVIVIHHLDSVWKAEVCERTTLDAARHSSHGVSTD
jgi:hypothetical protein